MTNAFWKIQNWQVRILDIFFAAPKLLEQIKAAHLEERQRSLQEKSKLDRLWCRDKTFTVIARYKKNQFYSIALLHELNEGG